MTRIKKIEKSKKPINYYDKYVIISYNRVIFNIYTYFIGDVIYGETYKGVCKVEIFERRAS